MKLIPSKDNALVTDISLHQFEIELTNEERYVLRRAAHICELAHKKLAEAYQDPDLETSFRSANLELEEALS
jgi:hypothetical protein